MNNKFDLLDIKIHAAKIRGTQIAIAEAYDKQIIRCPVHLSIGQEYWLPLLKIFRNDKDRFFSSHRSHSLYLALSDDIDSYLSELYGLENGVNGGKGGSMHLKSLKDGLEASIPIVGSSIGLSLGSALSHKIIEKNNCRTISYFGDGACEEGIFHESLNLAGIYSLPILFICENNMYSCNTHLRNRQTSSDMVRFAKSHNIKFEKICLNEQLESITNKLSLAFETSIKEPFFLEINSYRLFEHCGHKKDKVSGDRNEQEFTFFERIDYVSNWIKNDISVMNAYNDSYNYCSKKCEELSEKSICLKKI
tara:strand:+ start:414 stop:1334 length:921 start_codon:yes stop_codon:yes gene_type:complete